MFGFFAKFIFKLLHAFNYFRVLVQNALNVELFYIIFLALPLVDGVHFGAVLALNELIGLLKVVVRVGISHI